MVKKNLQVSFSGGRTSGFMSHYLKQNKSNEYNMLFCFANTGCEHEDTLRFANEVDKNFGLNLVWLEAVVHYDERKACTHKIVTYETASRNGEPFENVTKKYGLPNQTFKSCTRELKANVMASWAESIWGKDYEIAIGIRADEQRRVSPTATKQRIIYPLVDMIPTDKQDVLEFFKQYSWDLRIPEHYGNCVTCFQKSDKKLNMLYREDPKLFNFFQKLENLYSDVGPNNVPGPRKIYRLRRSTKDITETFRILNTDSSAMFNNEDSGTCSESCELFETVKI